MEFKEVGGVLRVCGVSGSRMEFDGIKLAFEKVGWSMKEYAGVCRSQIKFEKVGWSLIE